MHFLATKNIVHGDLAARNILVTKDYSQNIKTKISDFGLSKSLYYGYYRKKNNGHLPFKWMSFEAMKGMTYGHGHLILRLIQIPFSRRNRTSGVLVFAFGKC